MKFILREINQPFRKSDTATWLLYIYLNYYYILVYSLIINYRYQCTVLFILLPYFQNKFKHNLGSWVIINSNINSVIPCNFKILFIHNDVHIMTFTSRACNKRYLDSVSWQYYFNNFYTHNMLLYLLTFRYFSLCPKPHVMDLLTIIMYFHHHICLSV